MTGERDFELANDIAERQRQAGIDRARATLRRNPPLTGPIVCDCGEPISEARRQAVPNTRKCVQCAMLSEGRRRRRA
ncbi:MAG: TraR/DksA C4-type zinc finger protein [Mesorhizobium sp.]|nr:TraR/DksA C4-type zinc finger protein [Mesorhizobium sp.]MBN9243395.1 TraR/DksA C4-type zinc finger protein [Mesorhizobium sp.]